MLAAVISCRWRGGKRRSQTRTCAARFGEAYNPQRSGWSDAAYKSSFGTLDAHFDLDLPGATVQGLKVNPHRRSRMRSGH